MPLANEIQAQAAFKAFVTGTAHTTSTRNWFQENQLTKPILYAKDIRTNQPDYAETQSEADTFASNNPSIVEKVSLKEMTIAPGTNGMAYGLYDIPGDTNSQLLGDWISPFDGSGPGYFPRFYKDAAGTDEITTSFGSANWFFHAEAGLLVWGGETATDNWANAGVTQVYATVYRYVGPTLSSTAATAPTIEEFPISTTGVTSVTLSDTPIVGSEEVMWNGVDLTRGSVYDYTVSGDTINFVSGIALKPDDLIKVRYKPQ